MPRASCTISILFTPTRGGSRGATLGVNSNTFGSPHTIALSGTGTTPLTISPPALAFDNVNVGLASASKPVTIQNNQSIAAALTSVTTNGDFATTPAGTSCGSVLAANSSCTVAVVASPTVAGLTIGNLVIASDTSEPTSQVGAHGDRRQRRHRFPGITDVRHTDHRHDESGAAGRADESPDRAGGVHDISCRRLRGRERLRRDDPRRRARARSRSRSHRQSSARVQVPRRSTRPPR